MEEEIWKDIDGYEDLYQVSNYGRVKSLEINSNRGFVLRKGRIRKLGNSSGYRNVILSKNGQNKTTLVHRLVAIAFLLNPNNHPCVNHKDEIKSNNMVDNLEWCTYQYNSTYGTTIERMMKNSDFKALAESHKMPVLQYDLEGNFIKEWKSAIDCKLELGYDNSSIAKCCRGEMNSAYNYMWTYKDERENNITNKIEPNIIYRRKVDQFDLFGKYIKTWSSMSEAAKNLNITQGGISNCVLKKSNTSGGYVWRIAQ